MGCNIQCNAFGIEAGLIAWRVEEPRLRGSELGGDDRAGVVKFLTFQQFIDETHGMVL